MKNKSIGNIKDYTPKFKLIIPRFDIATWHDYIEENFRNIDALFFNLFGINNYSGPWKQITSYTEGQVLFVSDDRDINGEETEYSGRLVKVLVDHTTDNSDYFSTFYSIHPEYYELFADASSAQIFAQRAQNSANDAKTSEINAKNSENVSIEKQNEINNTISEFNEDVLQKTEQLAAQIADGVETMQQETAISTENVEKSRIWAEGEQEEVQNIGGSLSSMGSADLAYALANADEDVPIETSKMFALKVVKGPKGDKGDPGKDGKNGGGIEIGDIAPTVFGIDETKNLRRYLNGQVISQTQFKVFTNIIKERAKLYPNIITTEENWQAEVTNSMLSQCGKFVIDDELGTIRLPKVINIQGLQDLALMGSIVEAGLPNITGTHAGIYNSEGQSGALYGTYGDGNQWGSGASQNTLTNIHIDASLSNPIYGNSDTVQQEAVQYPYFIQVATGTEESVNVTREIELNNPFSLLDYKWSEYEITNASWLISNGTFHSGATYVAVYELLLKLHSGAETKDGVSVKLSTEEYTDTDFVLNTEETTFRLPIKVKLASGNAVVGNGMTLGFTNGTENFSVGCFYGSYGAQDSILYGAQVGTTGYTSSVQTIAGVGLTTDPEYSGIETSSSGLKLYFYVGETIQDANVINASGVLTEIADLKAHSIVETYVNGTSWYRVYSDGWCEQGGYVTNSSYSSTVSLLQTYANTNYNVIFGLQAETTSSDDSALCPFVRTSTKTVSSFDIYRYARAIYATFDIAWKASGYIR